MKTIKGEVISSKPVSISKAARVLSKFAASDNGAPPTFVAYLNRASASFEELVQLHKELKGNFKKRHKMGEGDEAEGREIEDYGSVGTRTEKQRSEGNVSRNEENLEEETEKKMKKKKKDKGERDDIDVKEEATDIVENGVSERKKHKKNKKENEEKENGSIGGSENIKVKTEGNEGKKKKRSREEKEKESVVKVQVEEEPHQKESKKRKHKGSDHGGLDASEEQHRSKKKSKKNEVDD